MRSHPVFSRYYAREAQRVESRGGAGLRRELLENLSGRVLEIGIGTGLSISHYPATVDHLSAIEPEPFLRERAQLVARLTDFNVSITAADAAKLPHPDGSFDAGVSSLVLCSVADVGQVVRELHRVIRPGGRLHFWEHVRSASPLKARLQRYCDLVRPQLAGGCRSDRDTLAIIEQEGFQLVTCRRLRFMPRLTAWPVSDVVVGRAQRC